jgi:hypothetical protein
MKELNLDGVEGVNMERQQDVSSQVYSGLAMALRVLEFVAVIVGVVLLVRIIYLFFGALDVAPGYRAVLSFTDPLTSPLSGVAPVDTPYDGVFDIAGTGILLLVMVMEFVVSAARGSLQRKSEQALIQQIATRARSVELEAARDEEPAVH